MRSKDFGLQLAVEKIVDDKLYVGDPFRIEKRACCIEQALVDVPAHHLARGADPLAEDPKPAPAAADVEGA